MNTVWDVSVCVSVLCKQLNKKLYTVCKIAIKVFCILNTSALHYFPIPIYKIVQLNVIITDKDERVCACLHKPGLLCDRSLHVPSGWLGAM